MEVILVIALIISIMRGQAYKAGVKALGIYIQKKGYNPPTDDELSECSREAVESIFHRGR